MNFGLSETQQTIKNSAREFFANECPIATVRQIAATDRAFDASLWKKCAEQGWTGIVVPEQYDGFGLGMVELAAAWEEMGRALVPGPFLSAVLLAGTVLDRAGSDAHKRQLLQPICRGELVATLALLEAGASWAVDAVGLSAHATSAGYSLTGEKLFVDDGGIADRLLVAVQAGGELAILAVPRTAAGVEIAPMPAVDLTRRWDRVSFADVSISRADMVARGAAARDALEAAIDVACVGLSAEMVGGMQRLLDLTVAYANTREQFGRKIGAFQAVQHMCADMLLLLEGARSAVYYAAWAISEGAPDARTAASVAKAYASDAFREVGNRAIQVQGGMGFTWENDAHLYYRRAKGAEVACGDATFHRDRIARWLLDSSVPETRR
jgi:alkylation response protein AidB-like acyl-CoA dehydrogenase